jgi:hypothetical protein
VYFVLKNYGSDRKEIIKDPYSVVDPDPYVFGTPGSGSGSISQRYGSVSFYHQAKIVRKPWFLLFSDFLSLKNDVNVPSKSTVISRSIFLKLGFCWRLEGQCRKNQDPDPNPDPLVRGMDPRIRIDTKMSRISNTGSTTQSYREREPYGNFQKEAPEEQSVDGTPAC